MGNLALLLIFVKSVKPELNTTIIDIAIRIFTKKCI